MNRILGLAAVAAICLTTAACTQTQKGAGFGALAGGTVGAIATGTPQGALVGAAVGGAGGALIGAVADSPGDCYYRDERGRRYVDRC